MLLICGVPHSGKTTLANYLSSDVKHTDDCMHLGWSEQSDEVSRWLDGTADIEGVTLPRALRKWLDRNNTGIPAKSILFLGSPIPRYSLKGQQSMADNCWTVFLEILPQLVARGSTITMVKNAIEYT